MDVEKSVCDAIACVNRYKLQTLLKRKDLVQIVRRTLASKSQIADVTLREKACIGVYRKLVSSRDAAAALVCASDAYSADHSIPVNKASVILIRELVIALAGRALRE